MTARRQLGVSLAVLLLGGGVLLTESCAGKGGGSAMSELANPPVLMPVAEDPTVSFAISFAVGSQDDPAGKQGLAALTAAMLAEGATQAHTYAEILDLLYPMAAGYRVRADVERTTFSGRVHRDNLDGYTALLLDAIRRPAFAEGDFERLRERSLATIEKTLRYSSDEELGKAALITTVFAGTPYGHLPIGTVEGLKNITLDDVRAFYNAHYTRDTVTLGLAGGYPESTLSSLAEGLAALPKGQPAATPAPRPTPIVGRHVVIVEKPGPATAISFGFPIAVLRGDNDFYPLWVANSWLGEHRSSSSHLYQVIREARGLNYGDYSYIEHFPEGGRRQMPPPLVPRRAQMFEVWIRPVPNQTAHFALRAAVRELDGLIADGLDAEQFALRTQFLSKYCLHFADTTSSRLGYAMDDRFYGIAAPGHLARFRDEMGRISREQVNTVARKYLQSGNMVIAIVTQDAAALADALAADEASPISYATPKPPEVLAEDRSISGYPLGISRENIRIVPVSEMLQR